MGFMFKIERTVPKFAAIVLAKKYVTLKGMNLMSFFN